MQDLGVPVDSVSLAVRTVYMEYHTARSKQISFVSAVGVVVIRPRTSGAGPAQDADSSASISCGPSSYVTEDAMYSTKLSGRQLAKVSRVLLDTEIDHNRFACCPHHHFHLGHHCSTLWLRSGLQSAAEPAVVHVDNTRLQAQIQRHAQIMHEFTRGISQLRAVR